MIINVFRQKTEYARQRFKMYRRSESEMQLFKMEMLIKCVSNHLDDFKNYVQGSTIYKDYVKFYDMNNYHSVFINGVFVEH